MKIYAAIGITLTLLAAVGGSFWLGRHAGEDAAALDCARAELATGAKAREAQDAGQQQSDAVADQSRAKAEEIVDTTRGEAATAREVIRYVYRDRPPSACVVADLPDRVRNEFATARSALVAAKGGLREAVEP